MKRVICASVLSVLVCMACNKKEPETGEGVVSAVRAGAVAAAEVISGKEIITDQPVKVGETGIVLPAKTKLCFSADNLEIRIELPAGFSFMTKEGVIADKAAPVFTTYTCICSASGSNCQVFYASGLGFGCLQSSCSGSCTGKFTYKGYTVEKVVATGSKEEFLKRPEVQKEIAAMQSIGAYSKHSLYDVPFYIVNDESKFLAAAKCECEGTQACKLKVVVMLPKKIYFCEGTCNGCELTV